MKKYILAIDQGTTSTRAILFDKEGNLCHVAQREFKQYFPHPGWVEHDANKIWSSVTEVVSQIFIENGIVASQIEGIEAIAYQSRDVIETMKEESSISLEQLSVDGGATSNEFLMQFQSDILDTKIMIPRVKETTALGAAYLAGLAVGFWDNTEEIRSMHAIIKSYQPKMSEEDRNRNYNGWKKAVEATRVFK